MLAVPTCVGGAGAAVAHSHEKRRRPPHGTALRVPRQIQWADSLELALAMVVLSTVIHVPCVLEADDT